MQGKHSTDTTVYLHLNHDDLTDFVTKLSKKLSYDSKESSYTIEIAAGNDMDDPANLEIRVTNIDDKAGETIYDTNPDFWERR